MKLTDKRYLIRAALVTALPLLAIGCFYFDSISQPEKALVETEINIVARLKIVTKTSNWDNPGKLVFAMLAPKAWKLAENATLSVTSVTNDSWRITPDVTDEALTLMPATEREHSTQAPWPEAFKSTMGVGDNNQQIAGDLEWTVWRSSSSFKAHDKIEGSENQYPDPIYATVKIRLKTGEEPISCDLGYSYCYDSQGFKDDGYGMHAGKEFKSIKTYIATFSTVPSVFRYGDIFAVQFAPKDTPLSDASEVYLCGRAVYNNGQTSEVTAAESRNRMERVSGKLFEKYIYPKQFFGLPADAVIEELWFYCSNADGSVVVTDGEKGYFVGQAEE